MNPHPWNRAQFDDLTSNRDTLPHALLIHGQRGVGKHALALALGQWLLCENRSERDACGRCGGCLWFLQDHHPDFRLLAPRAMKASEEGNKPEAGQARFIVVDQIRELADFLALSAHRNGAKVVLIDPAESMHPSAANALLKMLEEPPADVYWLLVSHETGRLLPTVVSRCRRIAVAVPTAGQVEGWLRERGLDEPALWLALAGGSPLAAMEQADGERRQRRQRFMKMLTDPDEHGWLDDGRVGDIEAGWCVRWLQQWVYDLLAIRFGGRLRYHLDQIEAARRLSEAAALPALLAFERRLRKASREVSHPLNFSLLLDDLFLGYVAVLENGHE
jgi:DNA polymerase III subunit delta'